MIAVEPHGGPNRGCRATRCLLRQVERRSRPARSSASIHGVRGRSRTGRRIRRSEHRLGRPGPPGGAGAVRTGRCNPGRSRRRPSRSSTGRRSRHGGPASAGTLRTPGPGPRRRRRGTTPARGLGRRQGSSRSGACRRSRRNGLTPPQSGGIVVRRFQHCQVRQRTSGNRRPHATRAPLTSCRLQSAVGGARAHHRPTAGGRTRQAAGGVVPTRPSAPCPGGPTGIR